MVNLLKLGMVHPIETVKYTKSILGRIVRPPHTFVELIELLGVRNTILYLEREIVQRRRGYPAAIGIHPSARCNLDCAFCVYQDIKPWRYRKKNLLSYEEFKTVVDESYCTRILFSGGEPLLNKEIYKMFEYAAQKGIVTELYSNAMLLTDVDKILDSKPTKIITALESTKKEVYESTKARGDYDRLRNNIERLISEKGKRGLKVPQVILQMVISQKNVDEIDDFINLARKLGADKVSVKPLGVWPQGDDEYKEKMFSEFVPDHPISRYKRDEKGNFVPRDRRRPCPSNHYAQVMSDGDVLLCTYDVMDYSKVGNINEESFARIWEKSANFRKKVMSKGDAFPICKECLGIGPSAREVRLK